MKKKNKNNKILRFFKFLYLKLFRINDTPQRVALGLGLGVFSGIMPGTGGIAALTLAFIFRFNRAAALLGSIITNTWLSVITFVLALQIGSRIFGVNGRDLQQEWTLFIKGFHWANLFKVSILKMILPILTGYAVISLSAGVLVYLISLAVVLIRKKSKEQ